MYRSDPAPRRGAVRSALAAARTTLAGLAVVPALALVLPLGAGWLDGAHAAGTGAATSSADGLRVAHVQGGDGGTLQVLVSVPPGSQVDLDAVSATVDGTAVTATAAAAGDGGPVRRTTVLAIDTSPSMRGERFAAARAAARTYLATVPADVQVGVVAFSATATTVLEPTTDRTAAAAAVDDLALSSGTSLYDGVVAATKAAGAVGQRSVLVLSDGADTSDTPLSEAVAAVRDGDVLVDVVSLSGSGATVTPLRELAEAGDGQVVAATPAALQRAFADEAKVLAEQVLVTLTPSPDLRVEEGTVAVDLPTSDGTTLATSAFVPLATLGFGTTSGGGPAVAGVTGFTLPAWFSYLAVAVLGLGLVAVALLLVPRAKAGLSPADRITRYTQQALPGQAPGPRIDTDQALDQVKEAAAGVLRRNAGLEERIARRLEAAGSGFRSSEWVLVHLGILVVSGLVGVLVGGGSLIVGVLFMLVGGVLPWVWLGVKAGKRMAAFNAQLPDTLQLISGSLSAGLSLAQALDTVVREGADPVAGEFNRVLVEARLGVPLEDAMGHVTERFPSRDFEWIVMAIKIQRQVGGNLAELLDTVAATMREREYLRRQVKSLSAEGRLSCYVLGGLPPVFLVYLLLTQRDYVMPLFTEPLGWLMLIGAGVMLAAGVFWMSRLVKVEV